MADAVQAEVVTDQTKPKERRFATMEEAKADYARRVLENVCWNITIAAFELDIDRRTLQRSIKRWKLKRRFED